MNILNTLKKIYDLNYQIDSKLKELEGLEKELDALRWEVSGYGEAVKTQLNMNRSGDVSDEANDIIYSSGLSPEEMLLKLKKLG